MAFTLTAESDDGPLSLDEYVATLQNEPALATEEGCLSPRGIALFARLLQDTSLVARAFNDRFQRPNTIQRDAMFDATSLELARSSRFLIRANFWLPDGERRPALQEFRRVFNVYYVPHNHVRFFMTGGYIGDGYETSIYEYCAKNHRAGRNVDLSPGDRIEMRFLETTTLPATKIMAYRAATDIHSQRRPKRFSVSINLVLLQQADHVRRQLFINVKKSLVVPEPAKDRLRLAPVRMASLVGNDRTADLLASIAVKHQDAELRCMALSSLTRLRPGVASDVVRRMVDDRVERVRSFARTLADRSSDETA